MWWKRLVTVVVGGALVTVGVLVPATAAVLVPAGTGLIGLALPSPFGDKPKGDLT